MRGARLAIAAVLSLAGCGDHGETPSRTFDATVEAMVGATDGGPMDSGADAEVSNEGLCDAWCVALSTACGAGEGDCAAECKARLPTLRGPCVATFREYFTCLLDSGDWACVSPGVVRTTGCHEPVDAWRACTR